MKPIYLLFALRNFETLNLLILQILNKTTEALMGEELGMILFISEALKPWRWGISGVIELDIDKYGELYI